MTFCLLALRLRQPSAPSSTWTDSRSCYTAVAKRSKPTDVGHPHAFPRLIRFLEVRNHSGSLKRCWTGCARIPTSCTRPHQGVPVGHGKWKRFSANAPTLLAPTNSVDQSERHTVVSLTPFPQCVVVWRRTAISLGAAFSPLLPIQGITRRKSARVSREPASGKLGINGYLEAEVC